MRETRHPTISEASLGETGPRNVLVVDDDEAVRELMAYVLESEGYTVFKARHSRDALNVNAAFPGIFHLLLTDICMRPHDDGFTLARDVRRSRPDIKVIYASGFVDHIKLKREMDAAPALFLPKPFTPAALVDCVRSALATGVPVPA